MERRAIRIKKVRRLFVGVVGIVIVAMVAYYLLTIREVNRSYRNRYDKKGEVGLRKFPYPYKAALSICSDIDATSSVEEFLRIQEFLNTKTLTDMGTGVGLEIGNSFFVYGVEDDGTRRGFSYFSNSHLDRKVIQDFIRAGYIDCLHSFGDGYEGRKDAVVGIRELGDQNCKVEVWVNHAFAKSNLGNWQATDMGDNIGSQYYHSDITIPYGIKFAELGCETNIIGQSTPITLNTFTRSFDPAYPIKSMRNVLKAFVKHLLAVFGLYRTRYSMYKENDLVKTTTLDDGQKVYQFMRYEIHPDGIGRGADSRGVAYNISKRVLDTLKQVNGYAILYTHFGKNSDSSDVIAEESREALRHLEKEYRTGEIYVTSTKKLLNYYINHRYLNWSFESQDSGIIIRISGVDDPIFGKSIPTVERLQGITFYIPSGRKARVFIGDQEVKSIWENPADHTDRESITIPLTYLQYPG